MLTERAELQIKPGSEDDFAAAMRERGIPLLKAVPGVKSARFGRGVENPDKFILLVEWESMDAHRAFQNAAANGELRQLIGPHARGAAMEHFEITPA